MKLNVGSDLDFREGWVNLDRVGNADVIHDLEIFPYPFKDNSFDYILASHVLEHLKDVPRVMNELWRMSKDGAIIEIKVPYYNNYNAFRDLSHIRFFTWDSFSPLALGKTRARGGHNVGYYNKMFSYVDRKLVWATTNKPILKHVANFINNLVNINPSWMEKRIPYWITIESLHIKLRVEKKSGNPISHEVTDEVIFKELEKLKKPYLMNSKEWKKKREEILKIDGKNWSK